MADAGCHRRFVENEIDLGFAPREELVGDGLGLGNANGLLLLSWKIRDGPLDSEQSPNSREGVLGSFGVRFERLEAVAPLVGPARDLTDHPAFGGAAVDGVRAGVD